MDILPDKLKTGDVIESKATRAVIQRTTERDKFDCVLYRLRFQTGVLSTGRYSRDDLQELGCILVERGDK